MHFFLLNIINQSIIVIGIIICNTSLKKLLLDIKKQYGLEYILTRKLNTDGLENLFSFLKGMAGSACNNITSLDFKYW